MAVHALDSTFRYGGPSVPPKGTPMHYIFERDDGTPQWFAEIAYRWRVDPQSEAAFFSALDQAAKEIVAWGRTRKLHVTCTILQPVIGPGLRIWELRVTLPSLKDVGELWDGLAGARATHGDGEKAFTSLAALRGADLLEDGSPLFRSWVRRSLPVAGLPKQEG